MNGLRKTFAIAAAVSMVGLSSVGAMAANEKLIVKDSGGSTNIFIVRSDGTGLTAPDSGFVGVGTAAPRSAVHISGSKQTFAQFKVSANEAAAGTNGGGGVLLTHNNGTALPLLNDRLGYMNVGAVDDLAPATNRFGGGFTFFADGNWSIDRGVTPNVSHLPTKLYIQTAGASGLMQTRLAILSNGNVGIGTTAPTAPLQVVGLPQYANNGAAVTGGLTAGAFYRTGADPDVVCVVH
jgi:hypothetical protein